GRPLHRPPEELARAFGPHPRRLRRRRHYRGRPAWQVFRTALADAPHRVIWPDLARRLAAVVPDGGVVPLNTVYGIATRSRDDAYALAALFNSRWLTALARLYADPARGGFRRFNARVVRGLPIPPRPLRDSSASSRAAAARCSQTPSASASRTSRSQSPSRSGRRSRWSSRRCWWTSGGRCSKSAGPRHLSSRMSR